MVGVSCGCLRKDGQEAYLVISVTDILMIELKGLFVVVGCF